MGTAEYYIKTTSDMIMDDNSLLNTLGVGGAARVNIGSMKQVLIYQLPRCCR